MFAITLRCGLRHRGVPACLCVILALGLASVAEAESLDLTDGIGESVTKKGAIFRVDTAAQVAATGPLNRFVRLHPADGATVERGYNTSARPLLFDQESETYLTHDIQLDQVAMITEGGVDYLQFLLDINEPDYYGHEYLSLDALQIYTSPTGSLSPGPSDFTPAGNELRGTLPLGTLRYSLDDPIGGENNEILLDYNEVGTADRSHMTALIPVSAFAGASTTDFVYLYSYFGAKPTEYTLCKKYWKAEGCYETWSIQKCPGETFPGDTPTVIPEPLTVLAVLASLAGLGRYVRRRRQVV